MGSTSVLITGGFGCIGSEAAKWLIQTTDYRVVVCSRSISEDRKARVFGDVDAARLTVVKADVTNPSKLSEILSEHRITHVAHMAGLQSPDCNAHRDLGLQVNLAGTQNLIEAMKSSEVPIQRFLFASSIAVYGPRSFYPDKVVPMLAPPQPVNVYGAWKLAGENISRIFHDDTGVPTISLRPGVLFGPGRDAGLTASPTTAMKHLALGKPFEIPFQSRQDFLYAPDVGAAVGHALVEPFDGYAAFTLPSHTAKVSTLVEAMKVAADELGIRDQFQISVGDAEVPFVCEIDFQPFMDAFPQTPHTPLRTAIRQSIEVFLDQARNGTLVIN